MGIDALRSGPALLKLTLNTLIGFRRQHQDGLLCQPAGHQFLKCRGPAIVSGQRVTGNIAHVNLSDINKEVLIVLKVTLDRVALVFVIPDSIKVRVPSAEMR